MQKFSSVLLQSCLILFFIACGNSPTDVPPEPDAYSKKVSEGWEQFSQRNFSDAKTLFTEAKKLSSDGSEAFAGMGWVYLIQDSIELARGQFSAGAQKTDADATADLFAGWAVSLNLADEFEASISQARHALELDPEWEFAGGLSLGTASLYLLLAENNFILGQFAKSLVWVQKLNPGFNADIFSASGQGVLAMEIERLSNTAG